MLAAAWVSGPVGVAREHCRQPRSINDCWQSSYDQQRLRQTLLSYT